MISNLSLIPWCQIQSKYPHSPKARIRIWICLLCHFVQNAVTSWAAFVCFEKGSRATCSPDLVPLKRSGVEAPHNHRSQSSKFKHLQQTLYFTINRFPVLFPVRLVSRDSAVEFRQHDSSPAPLVQLKLVSTHNSSVRVDEKRTTALCCELWFVCFYGGWRDVLPNWVWHNLEKSFEAWVQSAQHTTGIFWAARKKQSTSLHRSCRWSVGNLARLFSFGVFVRCKICLQKSWNWIISHQKAACCSHPDT